MEMNKKAVFFTFIAIFVVILIVAVVSTKSSYRYRERSASLLTRVKTMNSFISDLEKDLDREMFIGGYRALLGMNSYIRENENYVEDLNQVFSAIFVNGEVNGTVIEIMKQKDSDIEKGADMTSWLARVQEEADNLNIDIDIEVIQTKIEHISPWKVNLSLNLTLNLQDKKGLAYYAFNKVYSKEFIIIGFEDPIYIVETRDKVTNIINKSDTLDFVNDTNNDTTALETHLLLSHYIESTSAPSYLMRITGNLSPSPYGIESLVNLEALDTQGIAIEKKSLVDYIYFSNQTTNDFCNVTDMPSWFRIDDNHLVVYEIDKLKKSGCT
jgi:hypothetical protein